jgi:hypothetical protein
MNTPKTQFHLYTTHELKYKTSAAPALRLNGGSARDAAALRPSTSCSTSVTGDRNGRNHGNRIIGRNTDSRTVRGGGSDGYVNKSGSGAKLIHASSTATDISRGGHKCLHRRRNTSRQGPRSSSLALAECRCINGRHLVCGRQLVGSPLQRTIPVPQPLDTLKCHIAVNAP